MENTTTTSAGFAAMLSSGLDPVDREWGGLYRGGAYLVFGRASSGRGLFALSYAKTGVEQGERCLFIASDRPKDLAIQAASVGFDLKHAQKTSALRLMRIPPMMDLQSMGDDAVAKALWDLVTILKKERPDRVVINDFMPFVMFRSFDRFRMEFIRMLEQIDSLETTVLVGLPEPANQQSRRVIDFIAGQLTGAIHVELMDDDPSSTDRRLTLIPHIGQIKRKSTVAWNLADVVRPPEISERLVDVAPDPEPVAPKESKAPSAAPVETISETIEEPTAEDRYADRDAFLERLQQHFMDRDEEGRPFLLLAMRMDRSGDKARPFDFDFILDLVADSLRPNDDMLISAGNERLVVLLADAKPEDAQGFFARLKNRLRADAPQQADHLLHAVSAIVVPDGRPFQGADEFLSYALDEA